MRKAEQLDLAYSGYLQYKTYRVTLTEPEEPLIGGFVHGPGHLVAAIAPLAFDQQGLPHCVLKTGDTRLSRFERGEPYVLPGIVAGRMDKEGACASKIVLAELAEEIGGEIVEGTFLPLGEQPVPTMPWESTEADQYYMAAIAITGLPYGDGGAMEVVDLIGPLVLPVSEAIAAMDSGQVAEGARARTVFCRALDLLGYLPELGVFVQDHPRLAERFNTSGLGSTIDLRAKVARGPIPGPPDPKDSLEARINEVVCLTREERQVDGHCRMVSATTQHAVRDGATLTQVGPSFPNEYLQLDYDRVKLARYGLDPRRGPVLEMLPQSFPALAFGPAGLTVARRDVLDLPLSRLREPLEQLRSHGFSPINLLGEKTSASSGQCDLYYHLAAVEVEAEPHFVTLAEALSLCRTGHGDSHTEALLQRLARRLGWIPGLGIAVEEARLLLDSPL